MKDLSIVWLAGFLDADGSIRLSKGWKNKKGQFSLVPQITIHNTSYNTLEHVANILTTIIPSYQLSWKKRTSPNHAELASVVVMGIKRSKPLLKALLPYLVTKKLEGELLMEFIRIRESQNHNHSYSEKEYKINFALKYLKTTRNLRDYTPSVEQVLNEDIVRTNAKSLEEAEMASRLSKEKFKKVMADTMILNQKKRWVSK